MTSETPQASAPIELPWCVLSHDRASRDPSGRKRRRMRWCKLHAQPESGVPHYRDYPDSAPTACGNHVTPAGFDRREPTCDVKGCTPTKEPRVAKLRWTAALLRDGAKRIGVAADQLNASIERCEEALRAAEFKITASVPVEAGTLSWVLFAGRDGVANWHLVYATSPDHRWSAAHPTWTERGGLQIPPTILTRVPLAIRPHAVAALDDLLTALLAAEEEE